MTRVLPLLEFVTRPERVLRGCIGLVLLVVAWACADKVVGPTAAVPRGHIGVYADVAPAGITTLVIQVSGPGIVKPDASPDTLAFNIPLTNGVASGSLDVPAGPDRVITARAFVSITETHRGTVTANVLEGVNPTLHITMVPLVGNLPLTVSIGSTIVVVRPIAASKAVGDTLQLTSEIRDYNGTILDAKVRWATLNPNKATVDTNGLVTVKDTGDVQIVGTYGTVGGASKVSGVAVATVPSSIHLTWNGSVNTSWAEPNNWTPHGLGVARVPALTDSVVIPAGAPRMPTLQCVDNNAVRDIVIETGASLGSSCYALNVYGSAISRGPIPTVNLRPNAKIAGSFGQVYVKGDGARLIDSSTVTYLQVEIPVGTFALDGHKLRTTGDLTITDGTITMAAGDTLLVEGNVNWSGDDHNGFLTGGVIFARGNQFYGPRYYATGTSRLVLDRTATGLTSLAGFDYVNSANNSQINRLEIKSRDGATICGHIRVMDTLSIVSTGTPSTLSTCGGYQVRAFGPVITSVNTNVSNYLWELMHVTGTSLIGGTWQPSYTDFDVAAAVVKPDLNYGHVRFFASNSLSGNLASTGFLWIEGTGVEVALNGHKATFAQSLTVRNGGLLKMTNAADSLVVGEYAEFGTDQHGLQKPNLTAGVLIIGAYLDGFGFAASGTFKVVLAGTSASTSKYITRVNYESRPTQSFYDLEIASGVTYGLCERVRVDHNVVVKAGATLGEWCTNSNILKVVGDLVGETGSTIRSYQVVLNNATGTSNVAGAYNATYSDFALTNAPVKPGLAYQNLRFFAPNHLLGTTTATGHLWIEGATADLKIDGQTLTVGDYMQLQNGGTLTMTNPADVVNVGNYATFNWDASAVELPKLTAGTLRVGGYFDGFGFSAGGTHTVELTGSYPSTSRYITRVSYSSRPSQAFQNLTITGTASYGLCEFVAVKGTMTVQTGGTLGQWCTNSNHLRIDGNLVVESGATFNVYDVVLNNTIGTQNVAGTFTPVYTSITNAAAAGQLKPELGYTNVQFFTAASLGADMTVNGELNVDGPASVLTLNGHSLTVMGALNVRSNATLVMQNESDVLDVGGNVSWNGGGNQAGKLTQGTTIFRGDDVCATNYETSLFHTTVFERTGTMVRYRCVSSSSTQQLLAHVEVKGLGVTLECHMNVAQDIQVHEGATVRQNCGTGTLYVGQDLVTQAGSIVTNGPGYPGSHQLSVVFGNATGTEHVSGTYNPHVSYFTALNSYIQPTLSGNGIDYKHVRIDQSTTFQDSTEIDGGLELINAAIVDLGGHTVVVHGSMDFNATSRLKMVSPNDTLVVGFSDPSADLLWDGGDNLNDGLNPLLTAGAIKFYGDRFYGPQYKATVSGSARHRVIFMSGASGALTIEGSPNFANLEIRTPRPVTNNGSNTLVKDSLIMGTSTTYAGTNYAQVQGDIVMAAGADLSVSTVYVDGDKGTSLVSGNFHPTVAAFRATTPAANAIKPTLAYQSMLIQNGQYVLSGPTTVAGNLDILTNGRLTINGQTLTVGGALAFGTSGGGLVMNQSSDVVSVAGTFQLNSGQVGSVLSAGTVTVSGDFNLFDNLAAFGTHKVVLTGSGAKSVSTSTSAARAFQNLDISGTGSVNLQSGIYVNDAFRILSTATVTNSNSGTTINGSLETASGSSFTATHLTFAGSSSAIAGSLSVPGTLTVNSGGTLSVPSGASLSTVNVNGTLNFLGSATSTQTLTVNSGGLASAPNLSTSLFVDFGRIQVNAGGTLDNNADRTGGGGFRYKLAGSPSGYQNLGTLVGPAPIGQ